MSKGKQRPPQYIRQSKGYQQNLYKKQMKEQDIQVPKSINIEKITKINRILGIVWIVLIFACGFFWTWIAAAVLSVVGAAYMGGFFVYMTNYSKKYLGAYKKMGVPKEMYMKQLKKNGTDAKSMERMSKLWDKIKVD